MQIDIVGRRLTVEPALSTHVQERLGFALGQHDQRISGVKVQLEDTNGPRGGGADKRCVLRVQLRPGSEIIIEESGDDLFTVISRAADRAKLNVGKQLAKQRGR